MKFRFRLILLSLIMISFAGFSQKGRFSLGLTGGYINSNTAFTKGTDQKSLPINSETFGLVFQHMSSKYAGLQISVQYARKGLSISDSIYWYKREIDYVEIPMMTHFEIGKKNIKLIINLGPQISFAINAKENFSDSINNIQKKGIVSLANATNKTKNFQFGLVAGVGVAYQTTHLTFQIEGRFYNSFTNVLTPGIYANFNNQTIGGYFSLLYNFPVKKPPIVDTDKIQKNQ